MMSGISNMSYYGYASGYPNPYPSTATARGIPKTSAVNGITRTGGTGPTAAATPVSSVSSAFNVMVTAIPAAQPGTPVQPVGAIRPVSDTALDKTDLLRRLETDPVAMAVRSRIHYLTDEPAQPLEMDGEKWSQGLSQLPKSGEMLDMADSVLGNETIPQMMQKTGKGLSGLLGMTGAEAVEAASPTYDSQDAQEVMEETECETCKRRKYQDGSDDPGVSFKTATHVAPELAASAVRGHENEHVIREQAEAVREDRHVVSQSVMYHTAICPECGKVYVSGGTTRTVTAGNSEEPYQPTESQEAEPTAAESLFGKA